MALFLVLTPLAQAEDEYADYRRVEKSFSGVQLLIEEARVRSCSIEYQAYHYFKANPAHQAVCIDLHGNLFATYRRSTGGIYGKKAGRCLGVHISYCDWR